MKIFFYSFQRAVKLFYTRIFVIVYSICLLLSPRFIRFSDKLIQKDINFKAPPLSGKLIAAIKLIAPHLHLKSNEKSRVYWEMDQNAACWAEDKAFSIYFQKGWKPRKILEIGPGLGRSVVFLSNKYKLNTSIFYLYESEGKTPRYLKNGPKFLDSFCGTIPMLEQVLQYNKIQNYQIIDAKKYGYELGKIHGTYDLIYGLYSVGFHWNINFFIGDIFKKMSNEALAFFLVPGDWEATEKIRKIPYKLVDLESPHIPGDKNKMLIVSNNALLLDMPFIK